MMTWPLFKRLSTPHAPSDLSEVLRQKVKKNLSMARRPLLRRQFLAQTAVALALPLFLTACDGQSLPSYRYRLTVEVETPQGLKTGSSVIEVNTHYNGKGFPGPEAGGTAKSARGEAVAVDIAPGQTLFALLTSGGGDNGWPFSVMRHMVAPISFEDSASVGHSAPKNEAMLLARIMALKGVNPIPRTLKRPGDEIVDNYPQLVHFRDVRDPKSVAAVDPAHLDAAFGPGVRLKRITVQVTGDPVTRGIEGRLGWLGAYPEPSLNPNHGPTDYTISATLHHGDFRQGVN
jgi:hypothetical protein